MSIAFKASNINKKIYLNLENVDANTKTGARHGLYQLGKKLRHDVNKDILRKPRSGKVYASRGRGRHTASIAGEAPANWTGNLRKSLDWNVNGWETMKFGYKAEYGKYLEEGTKNMEARPGLKIAVKKNSRNGKKYIEQEIKKILQVKK